MRRCRAVAAQRRPPSVFARFSVRIRRGSEHLRESQFGTELAYTLHTSNASPEEFPMFSWAIAFFIIALLAAIFGFGGLAASAAGIAKIIFIVALILAIVSFVAGRRPAV
jgi:uncharacterized membrane protein YtjA (UPF0391 family)